MADNVRRVQYFYIEVADKPGEGARLLGMFKEAGVNLLAYSGFPAKDGKAQLDFVPADAAAFTAAAKKAQLTFTGPKTGFLIQGDDRVGAVAEIVGKLAKASINVTALDAVAAGGGRWGAIMWVKQADVDKAAKLLGAS